MGNITKRLDEIEGRVHPSAPEKDSSSLQLAGRIAPTAQLQVSPMGGFLRSRSHRRWGRGSADEWQNKRGGSFLSIDKPKKEDASEDEAKRAKKNDEIANEAEEE